MKKLVFIIFSISLVNSWSHAECRRVGLQTDSITGAITRISFCQEMSPKSTSSKEKQNGILDTAMNWMLETDGSQYGWIDDKYGWGLGYMTIDGEPYSWKLPTEVSDNGLNATYLIGDIELSVCRCPTTDGFRETYTFTNTSPDSKQLNNIGIYTPWNDNYPNAEECMTARYCCQPPFVSMSVNRRTTSTTLLYVTGMAFGLASASFSATLSPTIGVQSLP